LITEKFSILLNVTRDLEIDLAAVTRQEDYLEERLTFDQKDEIDMTASQEFRAK